MKTAKNTNKTIMNQYLIPLFSRIESRLILPAVLASVFILTSCVGSITVPTIVSNPNTQSFCEANPFRHSCNQAASESARKRIIAECEAGQVSNLCGDATAYSCYLNPENPQCDTVVKDFCEANPFKQQCTQEEFESARENIITECTTDSSGNLCGEATGYSCYLNPNGALCEQKDGLQEDTVNTNTNNEIASLKDDLQKANNAKTTADNDITRLKNELATAIGERDSATGDKTTANLRITELEGKLSTAEGERDTAKSRITTLEGRITELEGELSTAIGERDTAKGRITTLEGELQTAEGERDTANGRITTLEGELSTAEGERDTAKGMITTLEGQLSTAQGALSTANGKVTTLEGELSTAISERDSETGDKTAANLRITELQGELSTAKGERDIANGKVTTLEGQLSTATGALSTANGKVTTLEGQLSTATGALSTARGRITDLEGELSTAQGERDTAKGRITTLEGELSTATGERDTANGMITTLEGQLSTATGERDTAKGRITTLEGELSMAEGERDTAKDRITELEGQLSTAISERDSETGDKTTANLRITELEGQLSTAKGERDTARGRITTLEGELSTAQGERDTANGMITTLQGQLSTATGALSTANGRITDLEGKLSTAEGERDTAKSRITTLEGQLSTATGERDTARGRITTLEGELSTAKGERDTAIGERDTVIGERNTAIDERNTANGRITELEGQLSTATGALSTANMRITELEGQLSTAISERDAETGDKTTANLRITELEGELSTAIGERDTARGTITTLQGELSTAEGERDTANGKVTTLQGQLSTAQGALSTANGKITTLQGQLETVTGERDTARGKVTDLEGELSTANSNKNTVDAEVIRLTEQLRLAEEARLKELRDNHYPKYSLWEVAVNPDATPDLANPRNQFLQTTDGRLDTTGLTRCADSESHHICGAVGSRSAPTVHNINLTDTEFDGQYFAELGVGDINDGYAVFSGFIGEALYRYVGILDSTDLGAPLTGDAGTSVQWNGNGIFTITDFVLTITFDADGGRLDAFVPNTGNLFWRLQNARFDAGGVITGTLNYQYFTDSDPTKPIDTATDGDDNTGDSVLSGIIGEEGLVAVYVGALNDGFFAGPDITQNPDVRTSDWTRKVGKISDLATSVPRNQFLYSSSATRVFANSDGTGDVTAEPLSLNTATFVRNPLGSDNAARIEFFSGYNGGTRHYYAGLGGHLGATLPVWQTGQPTSAIWRGQFSVLQGGSARVDEDFRLEVNYQNRRLTAFVPVGTNHYLLDAGFNISDNGFFAGTVNFGAFTDTINRTSTNTLTSGVLTGLIGAEGALGMFVSGTSNDNGRTITGGEGEDGFAGGFVVDPTVPAPVVNYADWVRVANPDAKADLHHPRSQFLQSKDGTLDTTGVTKCRDSDDSEFRCGAVGSRTAPTVRNDHPETAHIQFDGRDINADINDGYAIFSGYIGETPYNYAGILDSTDLGAPLTDDAGTSVQWNGILSDTSGSFDFVLTITFDDTGGRLDAFFNRSSTLFYRLQNARFDTGGVITGTLNHQGFTDSDPTQPTGGSSDSVLSGIIGQEGAVAVFVGLHLGEFFAGPDITQNPIVQASDWTRKVGDIRAIVTSVPRNQFLTNHNRHRAHNIHANSDGTGDVTVQTLEVYDATFNGNPLGSSARGDIRFFSGYNGGTRHFYAGITDDTSLRRATLPVWETGQTTSAIWRGQFSVLQGANARVDKDLTLEVNFENRRLTAFVPVGANHYLLDAGFNADDDGFFAGTVNFGAFTDTTNRTSTNTLTSGVLTGIIGAKGAVGVFVSGSTTDNGRTITGGTGENGFAGGFLACPYHETNNRCQQ